MAEQKKTYFAHIQSWPRSGCFELVTLFQQRRYNGIYIGGKTKHRQVFIFIWPYMEDRLKSYK